MTLQIRSAKPDEISTYAIPCWINSYALGFCGKLMRADSRHGPGREQYWSAMRAKIERILATATTQVKVAVVDDDLAGFIVMDESCRRIHYIFSGRVYRRQGIATALLPAWYNDPTKGTVYLSHLPPPFYSRPNDGVPSKWPQHVAIDLITSI